MTVKLTTTDYILMNATVCTIKNFLCHDIKQAMPYHIMEFYVMTIVASPVATCNKLLLCSYFKQIAMFYIFISQQRFGNKLLF